jgi:exodeoxyribonuclease V beta subunit
MKKYLVLEANAGSGKTFSLVSRYLHLLFIGVKPEKIFALTFTKKATKEMYDRVISSLKYPESSGEISKIREELSLSADEVLEKSRNGLSLILNSEIKISTIDSFTNSILKKFSHYLQILPNFQVVDEIDKKRFHDIFTKNLHLSENREALYEIGRYDKNLKIETVLAELENLYKKEIEFERFSNQIRNLEVNLDSSYILELANLIKNWFKDGNLSNSGKKALEFKYISELLEKGWLKKEKLIEYSYFKKAKPSPDVEAVFQKLKSEIENFYSSRNILVLQNLFKLFRFYISEREKFVKQENRFSFDDLNHFLVKLLLDSRVDSKFIYFRLDSIVEHFLIDEFQDTSILQYRVLEPLISDILSGGSDSGKSFFYVGDKMQSLYRFRGGFSYLFDFVQVENPTLEKETLPKNYRSKDSVVNFVNRNFSTKQSSVKKGGFVKVKDVENSLESSISEVQNLLSNGVAPEDIAVICNKNRDVNYISEKLTEAGIPNYAESSLSLREYPKVKAIIQYFHFLYFKNSYYLKNFQALIGYPPYSRLEKILNISLNKPLFEIGIEVVQNFSIFDGDENILNFLDSLNRYRDIDDFIFNHHFQGGKVISPERDGVQILTVHKSKGLEFKFVIYTDIISKGRSGKSLTSYSGVDVSKHIWSFGEKENSLSETFQRVKEAEEILKEEDILNRMYVAFTRAEIGLVVLRSEKSSSLNYLPDLEIGTFGVESFEEYSRVEILEESVFDFYFPEDEPYYGSQVESVELEEDFEIDFENFKRVEFGTLLHSTLELMGEFSKDALEIALKNSQNRFEISEVELKSIEIRILKLLENLEFQNLISNGTLFKEREYRFKGKTYYLDLIVDSGDEVLVFDFKLSKNRTLLEKYWKQVSNYLKIVSEVEKKRSRGFLLYLHENRTILEEVKS